MLRVAAFTGGNAVPSARFRVRQYIPSLLQHGIDVKEMHSPFGIYPPQNKLIRPFWVGATLAERIPKVIKSHSYDVVLLQREMLSTFMTLEPFTKKPRILDVDDAIFLHRNGHFARRLAQISDRVICGNSYLADWFSSWNKDVRVIPTAVDTDLYVPPIKLTRSDDRLVIGWIGTSSNFVYLDAIEEALETVMNKSENTIIKIISNKKPIFNYLNSKHWQYVEWSEDIEIESIQDMDIGIMPLLDNEMARGKCSFKLLQYMACGIPVVTSNFGMNAEVLSIGDIGFGATTTTDWVDSLIELLEKPVLRRSKGTIGRQIVVNKFSTNFLASKIAACLKC